MAYGGVIGLVLKLKRNQRIFLGDMVIEIAYERGQVKLYIDGPKPFPFKITREDINVYRDRMKNSTYEGGNNEDGDYCMQPFQLTTTCS